MSSEDLIDYFGSDNKIKIYNEGFHAQKEWKKNKCETNLIQIIKRDCFDLLDKFVKNHPECINDLFGFCFECDFFFHEICKHCICKSTLLSIACLLQSIKCVKYLLNAGADTEIINENGKSALHLAIEIGAKNCVLLLLEAGANVNKRIDVINIDPENPRRKFSGPTPLLWNIISMGPVIFEELKTFSVARRKLFNLRWQSLEENDKDESNDILQILISHNADIDSVCGHDTSFYIGRFDIPFPPTGTYIYGLEISPLVAALQSRRDQKKAKILLAAGAKITDRIIATPFENQKLAKAAGFVVYEKKLLKPSRETHVFEAMLLEELCVQKIRRTLLHRDKTNLFITVPKLPLPKRIQSDLLYNECIEL